MVDARAHKRKFIDDYKIRAERNLNDKSCLLLARVIGTVESIARNLTYELKDKPGVKEKQTNEETVNEFNQAWEKMLKERDYLDDDSEAKELHEFFLNWVLSDRLKLNDDYWREILSNNLAYKWLVEGRLDINLLQPFIEMELEGYEAVTKIDADWQEDYQRLAAIFEGESGLTQDEDVFEYVEAKEGKTKAVKIGEYKQAYRYVQDHSWVSADLQMINTQGRYEAMDQWSWAGTNPLNLDLVNPVLPSKESLSELKDKSEGYKKLSVGGELQAEWQLAQAILEKQGIDVKDWQNWCLATKRLGLSSLARRFRNEELSRGMHELMIGDKEEGRRFLSEDEIRANIDKKVKDLRYVSRNYAIDAVRIITVLMRSDVDNQWGKYDFTADEWVEFYQKAYQCVRADYNRDSRPDSYVASIKASIVNSVIGHEQYYKSWDSYSDMATDFDEVDLIMFLPSIAEENENDPGFLLLAFKALMQMDEDLRIRYQPMIEASIKQLVKQTDSLNWLVRQSDNLNQSLVPDINIWFNSSYRPRRIARHDEIAIELHQKEPDLTARLDPRYMGDEINWIDPDVELTDNLELIAKLKRELILPERARMIDRVSTDLAPMVKELALDKEASGLKQWLTVAEVIEVLLGKDRPFDKTNLAETVVYLGAVIDTAIKLRGASQTEAEKLINSLDQPIDIKKISFESFNQLVWQGSGFIEREAVAAYTMTAMMAAFRISVRRVFMRLEEFKADNLAGELQEALELDYAQAFSKAVTEAGLSFYQNRARLKQLTDEVDTHVDSS